MILSAVILSRTDSEAVFRMTMNCIDSLLASEPSAEILLVESDKNYKAAFTYPQMVKVIVPDEHFNFHRFLNIGIQKASGKFVALCNNDLMFQPDWFLRIMEVAGSHPEIVSFSPSGHTSGTAQPEFIVGYKVMTHIKGWCFIVRKEIFKKIGKLDEQFDFYYADNDFAMTLKSHNMRHALVPAAVVLHLEKPKKESALADRNAAFVGRYKIPGYLSSPQYDWLFLSEKNLSGFLKFHRKWGSPKWLYRKNKLADLLQRAGLGAIVPLVFKIKL